MDYNKILKDFISTFLFFVLFSLILDQALELASNLLWAAGFTALWAVRDSLSVAKQKVFNVILYSIVVGIAILAMVFTPNTTRDFIMEIILLVIGSIRLYQAFQEA